VIEKGSSNKIIHLAVKSPHTKQAVDIIAQDFKPNAPTVVKKISLKKDEEKSESYSGMCSINSLFFLFLLLYYITCLQGHFSVVLTD
jgi:hypothetical protein